MPYTVKKGLTIKSGKHYGFGETISDEEFDKLSEKDQEHFAPVEEQEKSGDEENEQKEGTE